MKTKNEEGKQDFIKNLLLPLCQAINPDVESMTYIDSENTATGDELCKITFNNGYFKMVCITADSFSGIVKDVLRKVN